MRFPKIKDTYFKVNFLYIFGELIRIAIKLTRLKMLNTL